MAKQVAVEWKVRRGRHFRNFSCLPIDDAGQDVRQTQTGFHLIVDFACADPAPLSVIDRPGQRMELLDLQQPLRILAHSCCSDMYCRTNSVLRARPSSRLTASKFFEAWNQLNH